MEGGRWETRVTGAQGGDPLSLGASQVSSADVTVKAETLRAAGTRASTSALSKGFGMVYHTTF